MLLQPLEDSKQVVKAFGDLAKYVKDAPPMNPNVCDSMRDHMNRCYELIKYHVDREELRAERRQRAIDEVKETKRHAKFQEIADRLYDSESKSGGYPDLAAVVVMEQFDQGLDQFDDAQFASDFQRRIEGASNPQIVERGPTENIQLSEDPPSMEPVEEVSDGRFIEMRGQDNAGGSISGPGPTASVPED